MNIMLSEKQFILLFSIYSNSQLNSIPQKKLALPFSMSPHLIKRYYKKLKQDGFVDEKMCLTPTGIQAMAPYRVKNAIIMAAGMGQRLAPLSYEKPKGLLVVKGEVLIERQIKQLQEAGINDITVVIGYMKNKMLYLAEKMNVNIVVNEDYYRYNNTSSLIRVVDKLSNTYICSSDNYFSQNVFTPYVYQSYYAAVYEPGKTNEYCLKYNSNGRIEQVDIGGSESWYMFGHAYFSKEFSNKFVKILKTEYKSSITRMHLWEDMYLRHLDTLDLYIKTYNKDIIYEFDSLADLRKFDSSYII